MGISSVEQAAAQWRNPKDILSVLLILGGDVVQKAIANLNGRHISLGGKRRLALVPVAFSFGWVAFSYGSLLSCLGDGKLMPAPESPAILVNCASGFARDNQSWLLSRLLRDHEIQHPLKRRKRDAADASKTPAERNEVIRIDIFNVEPCENAQVDWTWWFGWVTIAIQIGICIAPLAQWGDWIGFFNITLGTFLSLATGALPQWQAEKWSGLELRKEQVACLTRGNGHSHIMVLISQAGCWNLEALATSATEAHRMTAPILMLFSIMWTGLLITVAGMEEHSWFVLGIGALGTLQNIHAGAASRRPEASRMRLSKFERMPTIIATAQRTTDDPDCNVDLNQAMTEVDTWSVHVLKGDQTVAQPGDVGTGQEIAPWLRPRGQDKNNIANVQGALQELERHVPTAGLAMHRVFFPGGLSFQDESCRDNVDKKFWKQADHTKVARKRVEQCRREREREARIAQA